MSESSMYSNMWKRAKNLSKNVRENGLQALGGVVAFSLFFMMGLVTLGACLFAGVAAIIMMKWQQRKAAQNDVANPTEESAPNDPIVAA